MPSHTFNLSVLLIPEGESWAAQCLEFDIAAQGRTLHDAKANFERTFVGQIALDVLHGRQPMDGILPAPPEYWRAFENASRLLDRQPFRMPTSVQAMASAADLRVADAFRIAA